MGTYRLTAHSFMVIRLFVDLILFTPGTLLNIYVLLTPVILEHWTGLSAAGWLLLLIFGMDSQLIWFCRERLLGGALYCKMCSIVYALDLYSCVYMFEVITVKKPYSITGHLVCKSKVQLSLIKNPCDMHVRNILSNVAISQAIHIPSVNIHHAGRYQHSVINCK